MVKLRSSIAIALSVGGAVLIGACGSTEQETVTVSQTSAPTPPPPSPAAQAKEAVRTYYQSVNSGNYGAAWQEFSPSLQADNDGFASWRSGYADTADTKLTSLSTESRSRHHVVEEISLVAHAIDACGDRVEQTYSGSWALDQIAGRFVATALDVSQTGGSELITDPSQCQIETQPPPPPPPPTTGAADCDPNYSGACLDPNSYDYDCEGGSGNGPDYTGPVEVVGEDHYGLDADGDGYACES
jgi:hypothetical protein